MIIGHIAGLAFLPVSIILFLNEFGVTSMEKLLGVNILLLGAIGVVATELGDIISAHLRDENKFLMWIVCILLSAPAVIYFLSGIVPFPEKLMTSLPLIIASFLFVEGLSSFFIVD